MRKLQLLVKTSPRCGAALVPHYRQFIPLIALMRNRNKNLGDKMDYGQRKGLNTGDAIDATLEALERYGGP